MPVSSPQKPKDSAVQTKVKYEQRYYTDSLEETLKAGNRTGPREVILDGGTLRFEKDGRQLTVDLDFLEQLIAALDKVGSVSPHDHAGDPIPLSSTTGTLEMDRGGTGRGGFEEGLVISSGQGLSSLPLGEDGQVLGGNLEWHESDQKRIDELETRFNGLKIPVIEGMISQGELDAAVENLAEADHTHNVKFRDIDDVLPPEKGGTGLSSVPMVGIIQNKLGQEGTVLTSRDGEPIWEDLPEIVFPEPDLSGFLTGDDIQDLAKADHTHEASSDIQPVELGGTGLDSIEQGELLVGMGPNIIGILGKGVDKEVLTSVEGIPRWIPLTTSGLNTVLQKGNLTDGKDIVVSAGDRLLLQGGGNHLILVPGNVAKTDRIVRFPDPGDNVDIVYTGSKQTLVGKVLTDAIFNGTLNAIGAKWGDLGTVEKINLTGGQINGINVESLEADPASGAILPPILSNTQREGLTEVAEGTIVYDTTDRTWYGYNGKRWVPLG